ncbi:hypothetical protein SDC9_96421 [bioreactor metagenome]|uniref:Uncharacterized protein n=1 Tax=bioreactor metagenome TaxID=1076179 RepID=A0A645ABP9_9ZZZZ
MRLGESGFKFQDIVDIGSAKRINALRIITHHTNPVMQFCQLLYDKVLREIGILILVNEHKLKTVPVIFQHIGVIAQQDIGVHQQIIKVHAVGGLQPVLVTLVNFEQLRAFGSTVVLNYLPVLGIHSRRYQTVLRSRYLVMNSSRPVHLVVQLHLFND